MQRLQEVGDERSWDEFCEIYRGFIYSIVRKMSATDSQTDDIIQEVLFSVWKALPGFEYDRSKGRFSSWLATITINTVKSSQLKQSRQSLRDHKVFCEQPQSKDSELKLQIEREWAAFLTRKAWENVAPTLSPSMRSCFEGIMDGRTVKDIAADLGMPENTVSVYKKRVNTIMRREIHRLSDKLG